MEIFTGKTKVEQAQNKIGMSSTFKIEKTAQEIENQKKHEQVITHVGDAKGIKPEDWGVMANETTKNKRKGKGSKGPLIQMEDEDMREVEEHQLKVV